MNLTLWTGIREYIDAEIKLAFARQDLAFASAAGNDEDVRRAAERVRGLENQSTRMETSVREAL